MTIELGNVVKRFGSVTALDGVSAAFLPGEVHAVVGENGAGKSTLASIVSGFISPDSGSASLDEKPLPLGRPFDCKRLGIQMIHQHFTLVPEFTVAENLALAHLDRLTRRLDALERAQPALEAGERLGWRFDPTAKVRNLPVGLQQRLEILKALGEDAKVILFDEPSAVLTQGEVQELLRVIRRLRDEGRTVLLIAHKLAEVMAVADRDTVLRRGKKVAEALRGGFTEGELAHWMVGEMPPAKAFESGTTRGPGLTVTDLRVLGSRGETAVDGISLAIQRGEIVGIGGVDGNGQLELAETLAGVREQASGSVSWSGKDVRQVDVGYIPQDRRRDGLALRMSIAENMLLSKSARGALAKGPFLPMSAIRAWARGLIERFAIKAVSESQAVGSLSGGNQQKVVVSRTLDRVPDLLVVAGPSRGLDIRAAAFVHEQILAAKEAGAAVALFSSDLDELAALSDRTVYLSRGKVFEGADQVSVLGGPA